MTDSTPGRYSTETLYCDESSVYRGTFRIREFLAPRRKACRGSVRDGFRVSFDSKSELSAFVPLREISSEIKLVNEIVTKIEQRKMEIVVTRNGKPAAVFVNYDE